MLPKGWAMPHDAGGDVLVGQIRIGRSQGCFAVPPGVQELFHGLEILAGEAAWPLSHRQKGWNLVEAGLDELTEPFQVVGGSHAIGVGMGHLTNHIGSLIYEDKGLRMGTEAVEPPQCLGVGLCPGLALIGRKGPEFLEPRRQGLAGQVREGMPILFTHSLELPVDLGLELVSYEGLVIGVCGPGQFLRELGEGDLGVGHHGAHV